jgi:hypothetical protein
MAILIDSAPLRLGSLSLTLLVTVGCDDRADDNRVLYNASFLGKLQSVVQASAPRKGYPANQADFVLRVEDVARIHGRLIQIQGQFEVVDYWNRPIRYLRDESEIRIWSSGRNGIDEGGEGDDQIVASPR